MLKIAVYHYRVPLSLVKEVTGRKRFYGPPSLFVSDRIRRKRKMPVSNRGGKTIVEVTDPTGNVDGGPLLIATGVAVCSMSENFDYREGASKALWGAKQVIFSGVDTYTRTHKEWDEAVDVFYDRHEIHVERITPMPMHVKDRDEDAATTVAGTVPTASEVWAGIVERLRELAVLAEKTMGEGHSKSEQALPPKNRRKSKKKEA